MSTISGNRNCEEQAAESRYTYKQLVNHFGDD